MLRKLIATTAVLSLAVAAYAQVPPVISAGIVSGSANMAIVDISVDIDDAGGDAWTAAGLRADSMNGAAFVYATDPNSGDNIFSAPDTGNGGREVTFVSLPRDQNANSRFRGAGEASIAGAFDPTGPTPEGTADVANIAFLEFPPTGTQGDGFLTRVAMDISEVAGAVDGTAYLGPRQNAGDIQIATIRSAHATLNVPSPLTEASFDVFVVPEPTSVILLVLGGLAAFRRR